MVALKSDCVAYCVAIPSHSSIIRSIVAASYVKKQLREVKLKPNPAIKSNRINAIAINNVQYANQI